MRAFLGQPFATMVKFVVDLEKRIIALGGELHADAEELLLEQGSEQYSLWGGNIYPDETPDRKLVYESLINIRPPANRSLSVQDPLIQQRIQGIVRELIEL